MKSLFSVFLGCAGAVLVQNSQAKQEKAPPQPMGTGAAGRYYYCFVLIP